MKMTLAALGLALAASALADTAFDAPGNFNPIVPGYFADPTIKQFGDTFYLYATTDGNGGGRGPATVWVSRDFVNWVLVPMNWPSTPHYWAPDVVRRPDGRYYLYYNQPCNTFGAVSDTPIGPWTPLTPGDGLVIKDRLVKDVITLDTQLFEDKDGTLYGYWGTWGIYPNSGCGFGVFNPDMKSFSRLGMIPNTQAKDFFEGPLMIERNGVYYFTYSSGSCHDATYRVQYAVSGRPDGEFKMGPNNPILASSDDGTVHGPGHHSILHRGEDYFIIYHRHDLPVTPNGMHRQTCADRLVFEKDGVIKKVEPTHQGIGLLGRKNSSENIAFKKTAIADSHYRDTVRNHEYKPEYAVDDNNATLWRPADNHMGHWLRVDLGAPQRIRRTEAQFEYATWYYQYVIEISIDGNEWQSFADRRENSRWGSPMVDEGDVEARFVRITITGTELPGLFGALWNFKVYSEAPADPLLALAEKSFEQWVAPKARARGVDSQPVEAIGGGSAPIIALEVAGLALGSPLPVWTNRGTLRGEFKCAEAPPIVDVAAGRKAVRFFGNHLLTASFPAPRSLSGNSSFTVAAWVNNPEIAESECLLSWAGRGGPDATTAQFNYGAHREFGTVGHWGFADMGFRGAPPEAGKWHHLAVVFDGVIERVYVDGRINNSEAKMLLMHPGRPMYVGASEPGTEFFDGYIASLRVYDRALDETQVKMLAGNPPEASVVVHADSAKLDYGPLASWASSGLAASSFKSGNQPPVVEAVSGRIAVRFEKGQSMKLVFPSPITLPGFSVMATVLNPSAEKIQCVADLLVSGGGTIRVPASVPSKGWHQVAVLPGNGVLRVLVDGRQVQQQAIPGSGSITLQGVRIGSDTADDLAFSGSLARVQVFNRVLSDSDVRRLHAVWKTEWTPPSPSPVVFAARPAALNPTSILLTAQRGKSSRGSVEYRFTETTGAPGGSSSGWISVPFFLDEGLSAGQRYAYSVAMRDPLGNVTAPSAPVAVSTSPDQFQVLEDAFDTERDLLGQGVYGIWDGALGTNDHSAPEAITVQDGVLRLQSKGTVWDGGQPLGPFLFKNVSGDFVAQTTVADYAGLSARRVPGNNDGGLMVRVPKMEDAGPGEDLVQLNFFPIWNQGNMVSSLDGGRSQKGNMLAWEAHRHLQIVRQGAFFFFRTSADGQTWKDMPGSPVERLDMAGMPVQVGLYHASYGGESSWITFADFKLVLLREAAAKTQEATK